MDSQEKYFCISPVMKIMFSFVGGSEMLGVLHIHYCASLHAVFQITFALIYTKFYVVQAIENRGLEQIMHHNRTRVSEMKK